MTVEQALQYTNEWFREFNFVVESSNLPADIHTMTISATTGVSLSGNGALTRAQVEAFLNNWNASVDSVAVNSVTFTIGIFDAIKSNGFWNRDVSSVTFTEVAYTQGNGGHRIRVDYPGVVTAEYVEGAIKDRGGVIVSHNTETRRVTFDILRSDVRNHFETTVINRLGRTWNRRRFRLTDAEVTAIEGAGGFVIRTLAQVQASIRDRHTE